MSFLRLSIFVPVLAIMLAGCATPVTYSPANAPEYMVLKDYTPFYLLGPGQVQGPDATLPAKTYLKLLRREMGYSYVLLDDGRNGYVPNDNIMIAPPRPKVEAVNGYPVDSVSGPKKHAKYAEPVFNDVPMPEASAPPAQLDVAPEVMPAAAPTPVVSPQDQPKFRY